jgi:hypothetical protein
VPYSGLRYTDCSCIRQTNPLRSITCNPVVNFRHPSQQTLRRVDDLSQQAQTIESISGHTYIRKRVSLNFFVEKLILQGGTTYGSNAPPVSVSAQYGVSAVKNSLSLHKRDFYLICMQNSSSYPCILVLSVIPALVRANRGHYPPRRQNVDPNRIPNTHLTYRERCHIFSLHRFGS